MKYRTATRSQCRDWGRARKSGQAYEFVPASVGRGDGFDEERIAAAAARIRELVVREGASRNRLDQVEGKASAFLYRALTPGGGTGGRDVPVEVLDDPGFWRYLCLKWFWGFVEWRQWREPELFRETVHLVYVDATRPADCVLTRMYLRMAALGGPGNEHLASCLPRATDFWRSHILRVRTAGAPALVRAMVKAQRDAPLKTPEVRQLAKRVNRTWPNLVLDLYSEEDATQLVAELREGFGDEPVGTSEDSDP